MPVLSSRRQRPPIDVPSVTHRPASVHVSGRNTATVSVALHEGNRRSCPVLRNSVARYCNLVLLGKVLLSLDLEPKTRLVASPLRELDRQLADPCRLELVGAQYPPVPGKDRTGRAFGSRTCEQLAAPPSKAIPFVRRRTSSACWLAVIIPTIDHLLSRRRHFPCGPVRGSSPVKAQSPTVIRASLIGYGTTRRAGALPHEPTPTRCRVFGRLAANAAATASA